MKFPAFVGRPPVEPQPIRTIVRTGEPAASRVTARMLCEVVRAGRTTEPNGSTPSCIVLAAGVRDFFVASGIEATCVPIHLIAANAVANALMREGRLPTDVRAARRLGAWVQSSAFADTAGGWAGHLITVVDSTWLVDPTLDYANVRKAGFHFGPVILDRGGELTERGVVSFQYDDNFVVYQHNAANDRYLGTPAWAFDARRAQFMVTLGCLDSFQSSEALALFASQTSHPELTDVIA